MPETDLSECPAPNPLSRPGWDRAMSYPLDNPRKEDPPVPVGHYYFETLNNELIFHLAFYKMFKHLTCYYF